MNKSLERNVSELLELAPNHFFKFVPNQLLMMRVMGSPVSIHKLSFVFYRTVVAMGKADFVECVQLLQRHSVSDSKFSVDGSIALRERLFITLR